MAEIINETLNEKVEDTNELRQVRVDKLSALQEAGKDPFQITLAEQNTLNAEVTARFEAYEAEVALLPEEEKPEQVKIGDICICGRIMTWRDMGKANFIDVTDRSGRMQVYVRMNDIGEDAFAEFKKWDIGDIVGVKGIVFKTQTEEISIHANHIEILAKSLLPLPEKFHGLTNNDLRFRQRYVDLIMNPNVRRNFIIRSQFIKFMRKYLDDMNYIEVETPVLNTIVGGAAAVGTLFPGAGEGLFGDQHHREADHRCSNHRRTGSGLQCGQFSVQS